jgi:hypothetical protein
LHSFAPEHIAPSSFRPHELAAHVFGVRHWLLVEQALKQREVPLQTYGLHGMRSGATHWPVALQVDGALYTFAVQLSSAQSVPTGQLWQPPLPSHFPFVMQVLCGIAVHTARGSGVPAAIGVQRPSDALKLQLRHAPVQA